MNEEQERNPSTGFPIAPYKLEPKQKAKYTAYHENITQALYTEDEMKRYIEKHKVCSVYEHRLVYQRTRSHLIIDRT